ncbi:MAG: UDP-N-acetylmuramoyl-tripeptide--D-alanyl-D-alanine ligase, partial [Gemmatimonadetes bacterium]|nr:UDP-N-acetylmuramoyl-tripeptide--D-alanyl-D-alanine ligase [Gemmatimonadota bacterium]
ALGLPSADVEHNYPGISTDSRTIDAGELFVALRGEHFDAADFLAQAAERGARGAIVETGREDATLPLEYFAVPEPLDALRRLGAVVRRETSARVVAVTGSSGKTTVKEMIAAALGETGRVYRTEGNLNSQIGLPLTILRAPADADTWVLEVGASEPGEIGRLARIAAPDHAIVTTVGAAHLEFFGDVGGVLDEKLELVRGASPDGAVVVGDRPAMLGEAAREIRSDATIAGVDPNATYRPDAVELGADRLSFERDGVTVALDVGGEHHLRDALIATALAESLGVPLEAAARGLARYRPLGMRGALRQIGDLTVLADCYNANPDSLRAAIAQCRRADPPRRLVAFVGSMLELGAHERTAHQDIADELVDAGFELVAATGLFAEARFEASRVITAADPDDAWEAFAGELSGDEMVLVKASRGARLERVVERLDARFGGDA